MFPSPTVVSSVVVAALDSKSVRFCYLEPEGTVCGESHWMCSFIYISLNLTYISSPKEPFDYENANDVVNRSEKLTSLLGAKSDRCFGWVGGKPKNSKVVCSNTLFHVTPIDMSHLATTTV